MLNRGSEWQRWEPHIHAPGTAMNNQFTGPNAWSDYLQALEEAIPKIEAIAVTDYYLTETYQEVLNYKALGRLRDVKLIFPNIEVRLDTATSRGSFVNLHLLVSPEDPNHLDELQRLLSRLQFNVLNDRFDCTRADLIRLGRKADPKLKDDAAALKHGVNQFKVNLQQLKDVYMGSDWAKQNILIAVAGSANDGTSGVRDAADQTLRREIESFSHVIFASGVAQREFWLGRRDLDPSEIKARYGSLKPCLHGSDAHKLEDVGAPFGDRFSWIKGGLEFDSLRQACIDPIGRAYVGSEPPSAAAPSQIIAEVEINNAPWLNTPSVPLNRGLVAIIGARGSGKTALADMIAAGCDSIPESVWLSDEWANPSFLIRARPLIGEGQVCIKWAGGDESERALNGSDAFDPDVYERVRYLSQQFVEDLCSSHGLTDGLLREIERVIFEAHPVADRDGALNFEELLELRASRFRLSRSREAEAVASLSDRIGTELEKEKLIANYKVQVAQKTKVIEGYTKDRAKLVSTGSEKRADRHAELSTAADNIRAKIKRFTNQRQTFLAIQDEVKDQRRNKGPETLRQTQARHSNSGLSAEQWQAFLLDYKGKVDSDLEDYLKWVDGKIDNLKGKAPAAVKPDLPLFADDSDLEQLTLAELEAEMARLAKLVNADLDAQRKYAALSKNIASENALLQELNRKLEDANGAKDRAKELQHEREQAYCRAFEAVCSEQAVLEELYAPLMNRLKLSTGTLRKLSFSVSRIADTEQWATDAEENLIDLRKAGAFKGKGTLTQKANEKLRNAWEIGTPESVIQAINEFRHLYQDELLEHSPVPRTEQADFRAWMKRFAQWFYGTDHISIEYGIEYDGIDIRKLSPGTRGIVLLLLYLALDDNDDRPLIIDQPEENLDPKSVFEELVGLFIEAKAKRQVIIVTHNANLVINTDADQIIIAEVGSHPPDSLPFITYKSGGLENAEIRKAVCNILEGGESAFQERARRLRVGLDRR